MKKFIVSALMALSCGVLFADTDMYLYWMIDEGEMSAVDLSGYTAKVSTGSGYLDLGYAVGQTSSKALSAPEVIGWDTLAHITSDPSSMSFLVELWNGSGDDSKLIYRSEEKSYDDLLPYISSMLGKATPADTYAFKNFYAVPEPTSGLLLLLGIAGLALKRKRM